MTALVAPAPYRAVLNLLLRILGSGAQSAQMLAEYLPYQAVHLIKDHLCNGPHKRLKLIMERVYGNQSQSRGFAF
jgi:hypothetical protein